MADTGWKSPSTNGTPATYDGSATEYTDAANAYADDASYATRVDNDVSYFYQSYGGFGFSIPAWATILGIEIHTKGKASAVAVTDAIYVYNSTSTNYYTTENSWTTTESTNTTGGATSLFGETWTPTNFSDANFHVIHRTGSSNNGRTTSLNHIEIKVYYNPDINLSVSDTVTITESITGQPSLPDTSVSDEISVTDSVTVFTNLYHVSVSDDITYTDALDEANIVGSRAVSDTITISDVVTIDTIKYGVGGRPKGSTPRNGGY